MNRTFIKLAAGCASALLLAGATSSANANYLGYGNGDPGNWSFWDEQNGGPVRETPPPAPHMRTVHHSYVHHSTHHLPNMPKRPDYRHS
jgi:hypothetical protein